MIDMRKLNQHLEGDEGEYMEKSREVLPDERRQKAKFQEVEMTTAKKGFIRR